MIWLMRDAPKYTFPLYAAPALLTVGNLGLGLVGLGVTVMHFDTHAGFPPAACRLVLVLATAAALCDLLDGPLARRLGCATRFGAILDSIADGVSFGLLPAAIVVAVAPEHGLLWGAAMVYLAAAVLRLWRFTRTVIEDHESKAVNTHATPTNPRYFPIQGLPTPAGGLILLAGLAMLQNGVLPITPSVAAAALAGVTAVAMHSPWRCPRPRWPYAGCISR